MQDLKNLDCLLPNTKEVLINLIATCTFLSKYVLVGGSALTLHMCHRKSEDLDFFTYEDSFSKKEIFEYLSIFKDKEIINQTDDQVDVLIDGVKVTFFNAKWKFLRPEKIEKFNLSSIEQISAMKVNVLFLRAKYRDYYDIYYLSKNGVSLKQMFDTSLKILEGINFKLLAIALLYIDDIEDDNISYLQPKDIITKEDIRTHFEMRLKDCM